MRKNPNNPTYVDDPNEFLLSVPQQLLVLPLFIGGLVAYGAALVEHDHTHAEDLYDTSIAIHASDLIALGVFKRRHSVAKQIKPTDFYIVSYWSNNSET